MKLQARRYSGEHVQRHFKLHGRIFFLSVLSVKPGNLTVWRSETRPGTTSTTLVRFPLVSMRLSSDPAPPCQRHLWRISWLTEVSPLGPLRRVVSPPEHRHITG